MKKFTLLLFVLMCFGIAKANLFSPRTFTISEINHMKNYEVAFKFFPQKIYRCGPAPKAESCQNKLMVENKSFDCAFGKRRQQIILRRWLSLSEPSA